MSEMVERVAKALCKAADDDWDWSVFYIVDANDTAETGRELYRKMARAAIEEMREPSEAMCTAGDECCGEYGCGVSRMREIFTAQIDAALQD